MQPTADRPYAQLFSVMNVTRNSAVADLVLVRYYAAGVRLTNGTALYRRGTFLESP